MVWKWDKFAYHANILKWQNNNYSIIHLFNKTIPSLKQQGKFNFIQFQGSYFQARVLQLSWQFYFQVTCNFRLTKIQNSSCSSSNNLIRVREKFSLKNPIDNCVTLNCKVTFVLLVLVHLLKNSLHFSRIFVFLFLHQNIFPLANTFALREKMIGLDSHPQGPKWWVFGHFWLGFERVIKYPELEYIWK